MSVINIGYFRVSKEDEDKQDLDRHIEVTRERFRPPEDWIILSERVSAYDEEKLEKRTEFLKLLSIVTNLNEITGLDIFKGKLRPKYEVINIYTYDYNRFSRIMEYALMFHICGNLCEFNIYSYNQIHMLSQKIKRDSPPDSKLTYFFHCGVLSYSAESYSYATSQNILKSVQEKDGVTIGTKDGVEKPWGAPIVKESGEKIIKVDEIVEIRDEIIKLMGDKKIYREIREIIYKKYDWKPSDGYLSNIKKTFKEEIKKCY